MVGDVSGNGIVDRGDRGLDGQQVFLDTNGNGAADSGEPTSTTTGGGFYEFTAVDPGTYTLRAVAPAGWRLTLPAAGQRDVIVRAGKRAKGKAFGLTQKVLIGGAAYLDANRNGLRDEGEVGMRNRRVFLDLNGDGLWQPNERSVRTNPQGQWVIRNQDAGTHRVGLVPKVGYVLITPFGGVHHVTLPNGGDTDTNVVFGDGPIVAVT